MREPPLITANTVLSILAVDYPAERVSCYVSDDGASLLTLEVLSGTCEFAKKWVPFCRKYNIEPRSPECYFSQKVDYFKYNTFPNFAKERRMIKRQYEEFKVQINSSIAKFQKIPPNGWTIKDGTLWPGNNTQNHPGMIQILLGRSGQLQCVDKELPQLVYVSREKRPGYCHNDKSGAMNALVRVSAVLTNGTYILNLDHNHYINNSKAFLEAMCFLMDPYHGGKAGFVQFPKSFNFSDADDHYAAQNTVFYDINMKCLDGIQGPFYVGTGCFFNRKALYGYNQSSKLNNKTFNEFMSRRKTLNDPPSPQDFDDNGLSSLTESNSHQSFSLSQLSLKKLFGESSSVIASAVGSDGYSESATPEELLKEAIHVISCDYEDNTAWGKEIGWMYGSRVGDMLTSFVMHTRGWRSIYCMPDRPAFKGYPPIFLSIRLNEVLQWALSSVEILFSRYCPIWYRTGCQLKWLQRISYVNSTVYPFTSIPLVIYCTLPAICLLTGRFILPLNSDIGSLWLLLLLLSIFVSGILEMRWSGVGIQEWWISQQFWVITGVSSHLFAVFHGLGKVCLGANRDLIMLTRASTESDLTDLYAFRWTFLLIVPTTLILINVWALVAGISSAISRGFVFWAPLFSRVFFSLLVIIHLYPFLKGLVVRQNRIPTIIIIWSLLLSMMFSLIWVRVDPFTTRYIGPSFSDCGINC